MLGEGEEIPVSITYSIHQVYTDNTSHQQIGQTEDTSTLSFNVCGVNDAPTATNDDAGCIVENGTASGNVIAGSIALGAASARRVARTPMPIAPTR